MIKKIEKIYQTIIEKYKWQFIFAILFPFMFASNFYIGDFNFDWLDNICKYWSIINCFIVFCIFFIIEKKKPSIFLLSIYIIGIWLLITTIINNTNNYYLIFKCFYYICRVFGICMLIEMYKNDGKELIKGFILHLELLIYLNFFTLLIAIIRLIADGKYTFFSGRSGYEILWFGNHNQTIVILLPAILLAFIYSILFKKKNRAYILIFVCLFTMVFSWSTTARIALVLGILILLLLIAIKKKNYLLAKLAIFTTICSLFLAFVFREGKFPFIDNISINLLHKKPTVSGRTPQWINGILAIEKKPIIGYGQNPFVEVKSGITIDHLHNEILQRLFETGIIGLLLFVWSQIVLIKKVDNHKQSKIKLLCICIIFMFYVVATVSNYTRFYYLYILFMFSYHLDEIIGTKELNSNEKKM